MNYEWIICSLDTRDEINNEGSTLENAVVNITWKRVGTDDGGNSATFLGRTQLTADSVSSDSFVGFTDLTEEAIINWITNSMSASELAEVDNIILRKITKQSTVTRNPPWTN